MYYICVIFPLVLLMYHREVVGFGFVVVVFFPPLLFHLQTKKK